MNATQVPFDYIHYVGRGLQRPLCLLNLASIRQLRIANKTFKSSEPTWVKVYRVAQLTFLGLIGVILFVRYSALWFLGRGICWFSKTQINLEGVKIKPVTHPSGLDQKIINYVKEYKETKLRYLIEKISTDEEKRSLGENFVIPPTFIDEIEGDIGLVGSGQKSSSSWHGKYYRWIFIQEYNNVNGLVAFVASKLSDKRETLPLLKRTNIIF